MRPSSEPGRVGSPGGATDWPAFEHRSALDLLAQCLERAWSSFRRPRPAEPAVPAVLAARLEDDLPDAPGHLPAVLADAAAVLDASVSPARPLNLAYVGSTGLEASGLGAALAATYDVNVAARAGAIEALERQTLRWLAQFVGYPSPDGIFTSGGMISNLTALLAARERALPGAREHGLGGRRMAVYCSVEAHHSVVRAVEVAGIGASAVRRIAIDGQRRMRPDALATAIEDDRRRGVLPVAVVATAGTTLTGAVDPLAAVASVCRAHDVWLHVDGAYGLPAAGVPSARAAFAGLEQADSVTVDAHKWMGIQKSCSVLLLRDRSALLETFSHREGYMPKEVDGANPVDATLEYSRPVNSVKLWVALRSHGAVAYRRWIASTIDLARHLARRLEARDDYECLHTPQLSTLCFRQLLPGTDPDDHNARLAQAVQDDGRVYLAPAVVDGATCLRVCFTNFRTRTDDVDALVAVLDELGARVVAAPAV